MLHLTVASGYFILQLNVAGVVLPGWRTLLHLSRLPKPSTARHNLANAPLYLRDLQKGKV